MTSPIVRAVIDGNLARVRELVASGVDVRRPIRDSTPLLHLAAELGNLGIVNFLIESGVDLNYNDRDDTPLHRAALHGHPHIVERLLAAGADVNAIYKSDAMGYSNKTPLAFAFEGYEGLMSYPGRTEEEIHNYENTIEILSRHGGSLFVGPLSKTDFNPMPAVAGSLASTLARQAWRRRRPAVLARAVRTAGAAPAFPAGGAGGAGGGAGGAGGAAPRKQGGGTRRRRISRRRKISRRRS